MYYVDLRSKITYNSVLTIFKTDSYDRAWDVANNYNRMYGNTDHEIDMLNNEDTEGWSDHPYWATVYEAGDGESVKPNFEAEAMKKYTIEDYEAFSREALDAPPVEDFEDGIIDENQWFEDNKILISKGRHQMELEYNADNVKIKFKNVGTGLTLASGSGETLVGFEFIKDGTAYPATAVLEGKDTVVLTGVTNATGVRYAFYMSAPKTAANLVNSQGLPCPTFAVGVESLKIDAISRGLME